MAEFISGLLIGALCAVWLLGYNYVKQRKWAVFIIDFIKERSNNA